jgi:hypothetical protein
MGADNMRKLMEAVEELTEKVRVVPASKVNWNEDEDGIPDVPEVKGIKGDWFLADHRDFNNTTFSMIAQAVYAHGLNVYVIVDTNGDWYWFCIAP